MRTRLMTVFLVMAVAAAAVPAGAADETTLTVTEISTTSSTVTVRGFLRLDSSAFAPMTVSTDPIGDATVAGHGFDIGDTVATVSGYATAPKLTLTMTVDGSLPPAFTGYSWPILVDGDDGGLWLGAGTAGTGGIVARTEPWVGLCQAGTMPDGGYWPPNGTCADREGSVGGTAVTWELPFGGSWVPYAGGRGRSGLKAGSQVEAGPSVWAGRPTSFVWPYRTGPVMDTASPAVGFKLPGGIEVGISNSVEDEPASYLAAGSINTKTGLYSVPFNHPGPGQHVLWVRSCHGLSDNLTCVRHTQDLTL